MTGKMPEEAMEAQLDDAKEAAPKAAETKAVTAKAPEATTIPTKIVPEKAHETKALHAGQAKPMHDERPREFSHEGKKFHGERTEQTPDLKKKSEKFTPQSVLRKNLFADYKLFNKWTINDVVVVDPSLVRYINLEVTIIPHSFGRKTRGRFAKANLNIVERLVNKIMRSGQGKRKLSGKFIRGRGACGKKMLALRIVENAFSIVEKQTKQNPIQVLVKAIENSAPREDVTRVKKGGVSYTLAVDISPMKRLDEAIKNIALAGFGNSFNKKVSAEQALAEEIIAAANHDSKSLALKRKDEVERIAKASR